MSQLWHSPFTGSQFYNLAMKTLLPDTLDSLRTLFSGGSAPSNPATYQLWADTTAGVLKMWDGSMWNILGPLNGLFGAIDETRAIGALSATTVKLFAAVESACVITRVVLTPATSTSGSSAGVTEWQWEVINKSESDESLFSGTVGTGTSLESVGGGELTANTRYVLFPDQNATLDAGDVLQFTATKVGSPTSLDDLLVKLWGYRKGA